MARFPSPSRPPRVALLVCVALLTTSCHLATLDEAESRARALPETSVIYAADGSVLARLHAGENRLLVPLAEVPLHVRGAVIAVEDRRFYQHSGVDLKAILRAA